MKYLVEEEGQGNVCRRIKAMDFSRK